MASVESIRRVTIQAKTQGVDEAKNKLGQLADAQEGVARASESAGKATLSMERRLDSLQRRLDEEYRAARQLEQVQRDLDKARAQGLITVERQNQLLSLAATKFQATKMANDNFAQSSANGAKLTGAQIQNLSFQLNDMATMLMSGASPFQVLATQGGQVYQALQMGPQGIGGSLKGVMELLVGMVNPARAATAVLVGGAAAATYAWYQFSQQQKQLMAALSGKGQGTNATSSDLNRIAEDSANAGRVSASAAREMAATYASTGRIGTDIFSGLIKIQKDYAATTKQGLGEATSELAKVFADPVKGAELLSDRLGSLGDKTLQLIKRQQAQGDTTGAQRTLFDAMNGSLVKHEAQLTAVGRAWEYIKTAASDVLDGIGKKLAPSLDEQARQAYRAYEEARRNVQDMARRPGNRVSQRDLARVEEAARAALDADALARNEQVVREFQAREAQAKAASERIGDIVRDVMPEIEQLDTLRSRAEDLRRGLADPAVLEKLGVTTDQAREALSRITIQLDNFKSATERLREDQALEIRAINARTVEERAAVEAERARIGVIRDSGDQLRAAVAAEGARNRLIAEANRRAQDALRSAKDQAELVGLKPLQRALKEEEQRARERREQFGTGGASSAGRLNTSFSENLQRLIEAIPGISISSGYRSTERQAQLWEDALRKYGSAEAARKWVAPPGSSQHNFGFAADLRFANNTARQEAHRRAGEFGLTFPLSNESWHVEPIGGRSGRGSASGSDGNILDEITLTRQSTIMREFTEGPLSEANQRLDEQIALTRRQAETFGMSTAEVTRQAEAQRLMNEYTRNGVTLTADLTAAIQAYAERAGRAAAEAESFGEKQKMLEDFQGIGKDALKGFISDLRAGKSGADALANALDRVVDKLLDMSIDGLFGKGGFNLLSLFGGGGAGIPYGSDGILPLGPMMHDGGLVGRDASGWKNIHPAYFENAPRYHDGLRPDEVPAILQKGEWVLSRDDVAAIRSGAGVAAAPPQPVVNLIGVPSEPQEVRTNPDGSLDVIWDAAEARVADRVSRRRGPLYKGMIGAADGRTLRG